MEDHKVTSFKSDKEFIVTESFLKLTKKFKSLKNTKGRIILVIGAPGTGKSSNIYHAIETVDLKYYEPILFIDNVKMSSKSVYNRINNILCEDLHVNTKNEVFTKLAKFDTVLVADKFLDSEYINKSKIGLAEWVSHKTILTIPFYILWMIEALKYRSALKKINLIFQTAWTVQIRGFKYDIITDFGIISKIFQIILKNLFEVVKIEYTDAETIEIVKSHNKSISPDEIKHYIKKYENKPRYILNDLEETS